MKIIFFPDRVSGCLGVEGRGHEVGVQNVKSRIERVL